MPLLEVDHVIPSKRKNLCRVETKLSAFDKHMAYLKRDLTVKESLWKVECQKWNLDTIEFRDHIYRKMEVLCNSSYHELCDAISSRLQDANLKQALLYYRLSQCFKMT